MKIKRDFLATQRKLLNLLFVSYSVHLLIYLLSLEVKLEYYILSFFCWGWAYSYKVIMLICLFLNITFMKVKMFVTESCPTLRPHGLQPARLLSPWNSPGENTGVGCHALLQGIFLTQVSNLGLLHQQADSLLSETWMCLIIDITANSIIIIGFTLSIVLV